MHIRRLVPIALAVVCAAVLSAHPAAAQDCAGGPAPEITGQTWINSAPLHLAQLRGQVVLVEFWTLGCSNCRNVEPHVKEWHRRYADRGLKVIGVHTPEFSYEEDPERVKNYAREHDIEHAIVTDNDSAIWDRFGNRYWPALYLIDKNGVICYTHVGEGGYERTEARIRDLLSQNRSGERPE